MSVAPEPVNPEHDPMTIDPANLGSVDPLSVEGLFLVALGKLGQERAAFLAEQCGDDDRRQRVEALLAAYESAGSFLQKPAIAIEPTPVGQYLAPCEVPGAIGKLGPYEILEEIGRGGMGVVFRAHDPKLQRIVAVKALAPELARLPSARQRFLREARAAAAISHPHVVTIFAVDGTEEASLGTERATLPYLVMECIVGQTLHDKIKRQGALKTEEIVRISRQIAEGLTAAHKRGLIHRDIKPANILLENGVERVKITDFGLARTTSDGGITHTGEILGTPQCMSPEQARGEMVDQRSDLFSLGCVMYTMCTGVNPFRADNMLAVMKKVCEATPRPIAQLNPEIPEWLCSLVHQLLEKQPELRVQTAGEVVEVLEARAVASGPRVATSPTQEGTKSFRQDPANVPQWLLTPIIPGLEQWLFKDSLLPVTLMAMLIGFFLGEDSETRILILPLVGILGFGLLSLAKVLLKAPWNWINLKTWITVPPAIFVGGVGRAWLIHRSRSSAGLVEELARNNAGWFVFPLAIAVFWLMTRYFRGLFIQNPKSASEAQSPPPRPTHWSTWAILGMTVIVVGMLALPHHSAPPRAVIESLLMVYVLALNLWIFVHLVAWGVRLAGSKDQTPQTAFSAANAALPPNVAARPPRSPWSVLGWILVAILGVGMLGAVLLAVGLIVPYLSMSSNSIPPSQLGPHEGRVILRGEKNRGLKSATLDGKALQVHPDLKGDLEVIGLPGIHTLHLTFESDPDQECFFTGQINLVAGQTTSVEATPVCRSVKYEAVTPAIVDPPMTMKPSTKPQITIFSPGSGNIASSIPLADAVEVLTDPAQMPAPATGVGKNGFGTIEQEMTQAVWIDEPGLLIRMKRLGFEGNERAELEYYSKVAWGTGPFMATTAMGEYAHHFPAGRYQVLVQDLDYGWQLDRRGTITIGNGPLYVHVKRTFQAHQKLSSGSDQFPLAFRWAGKTYQITTPNEVSVVNMLLTTLDTQSKATALVPDSFRTHPLFLEAVQIDPQGGGHSLKRERSVMKIDIRSPGLKAGYKTALGQIQWSGQAVFEAFVPRQAVQGVLSDDSLGLFEDISIPAAELETGTWVVRRDLNSIKRCAEDLKSYGGPHVVLDWFGTSVYVNVNRIPAARRLVLAIAEGKPDVPEAELLELGQVATLDELWVADKKTEQTLKAIVVPGKEPGTWRLKEPPEGAVVDGQPAKPVKVSPATAPTDAQVPTSSATPGSSIPLADAVEVLTDPKTMPHQLYVVQPGSENVTQVWVDEPGLIVRLKPIDFDGKESSDVEYEASCAWGLGNFQHVGDPHASTADLPVGRYRVLVQDLDYGWELDRRGTIVIGRGAQTIHVKRSFTGQQLKPEQKSVNFRWAGKSYQFTKPEQIANVNTMLASLAGEAPYSELGVQYKGYDFTVDPLGEQMTLGAGTLQHERRRMKLQFAEGATPKSVSVSHSSGTMTWSRPVPEGFTIPEGALRFSVLYQPGFWWPGDDTHPLDLANLPDQTLVVGRLTKAMMREAITRQEDLSQVQGLNMYWFREQSTRIQSSAAPAAKRLIQAWLDGQPDVPESELLALGKAENWSTLWQYFAETNNLMTDIVEPGKEPGTWRLKEPPEGAVLP